MKAVYQTLIGMAALSLVVGGVWIGMEIASGYEFNVHNFMITFAIVSFIYISDLLGGIILSKVKNER
jgi:hypothetical protein